MKTLHIILAISMTLAIFLPAGCDSERSKGSTTLLSAGIGALAGQAIGGDTKATLIGAGIGAGAGYIIGNSRDKKAAETHNYNSPTPLSNTTWKVTSLIMDNKPEYESLVVNFRPDGIVATTRFEPGGTKIITEEKYRIVGKTLIIHKSDYIINAEYKIYGNELVVNCERFRAVLTKL
jgi:hypothetical protein